jgi:uncharacterized protein GlcG (DUF336 family)
MERTAGDYNVAVVDAQGRLVAHARLDGAWLNSIDAETLRTGDAGAMTFKPPAPLAAAPSEALIGVTSRDHGTLVIFAGKVSAARSRSPRTGLW